MVELARKSPSKQIDEHDEEYKKMKRRILTIVSTSSQDDIFYEQRFDVSPRSLASDVGNEKTLAVVDM